MDAEEKQKAVQGAKVLEKHGRFDSAVQLFTQVGAYEEAARVLSSQRRFAEAAQLLASHLGVPIREVYSLGAEGKKMALLGAICYARAGHTTEAVELFVALREHQRAAEVLQKSGDSVGAARVLASAGTKFSAMSPPVELPRGVSGSAVTIESARKLEKLGKLELAIQAYVQLKRYGEAGRVARQLGKASDAASFYAEAGLVFDAGTCYVEAGDSGKALENFIRLPRDDAQYRAACLEGVLKVMDFGIAKRQLAKGVTVAGMVAGTPEYMSPEQITNFTAVTPSTDLYALGVVAYEMFTGHVPFRDPELVPLLMMHINDAPPSPRSANPSLSEGLEQIILKLLQKSPDERFADCGELRQALEALPSSQPSWTPRADPY